MIIGKIKLLHYGYFTSNNVSKQNDGVPSSTYLFYLTVNVSYKF